jgi:SAM-dependent methyltransferase
MLSIQDQLTTQKLVCPRTHSPLFLDGAELKTADRIQVYPYLNGVPILLKDTNRVEAELSQASGHMLAEYTRKRPWWRKVYERVNLSAGDMRTNASERAFQAIFRNLAPDALCLSIGGGPRRIHPLLVNLNIAPVENVDVVADAYYLPYAADSVDAIHCEAVLEHLELPDLAVREMHRVLRSGGRVFAATPFLQSYHGYPDHYQNFTLTGHVRLFERARFTIVSSGTCVGPTFMVRDLTSNYFRVLLPTVLGKALARATSLLLLPALRLDRLAARHPASAHLASSTFLEALKE